MRRLLLVPGILFSVCATFAQSSKDKWVDSVFQTLTHEEKVGQLFFVSASSYDKSEQLSTIIKLAQANKVSGLILRRSGPQGYVKLINSLQATSKTPVIVSADLADGLISAFDSVMNFFPPAVINAITSDSLLFQLGKEKSRQKKLLRLSLKYSAGDQSLEGLRIIEAVTVKTGPKSQKGDEEKLAFANGAEIILNPLNPEAGAKAILKVLKKDKALAARLEETVKKILAIKFDAGLAREKFINPDNLTQKLHTPEAHWLRQTIAQHAVTVVKNDSTLIPIQKLNDRKFVSISIGESTKNEFNHFLSKYAEFKKLSIITASDTTGIFSQLKDQEVIVISLFAASDAWIKNINPWINRLAQAHTVIVCSFTDPAFLSGMDNRSALLAGYTDDIEIQKAAAQIIFGGLEANGKLSVKISDSLPAGTSVRTSLSHRFSYTLPEEAGMDSRTLQRIEAIAQEAIDIKGTPGCHVLVAKDGKVIYERSFGFQTYEKKIPVTDETIYDLASVTKVSATLQAVMYMHEKGLIDINKKASVYLPELKKSNKEDYIIKDILTHQAGLWPYLPFWSETVKDSATFRKYYSRRANSNYYFPVAERLFAHKSMKDSLWQWIIKAKVRDKASHAIFDYRYSDMGFYIMQHLAEKMLHQPQEEFLQSTLYKPLGAYTTGYLPLRKFPYGQVAPTEKDTLFRKSLLIGYVHDQGAAMHGGIAGHAGLFSNANDLAKLGQMWLNKGSYGGIQFFKPETLELFTAKQFEDSRRGLGWDKPTPSDWNGPTSLYASARTFGHTGFTGTCIWVDPEFNLVYVFLSNRVHPDMNNTKILNANIRPRIQEVVYQSIFEYRKNHPTVETKRE